MQKKVKRKTLVAVERERDKHTHTLKTSRGITLIALAISTKCLQH